MSEQSKIRTEEFQINGEELLGKVKELVHEGTIRRVIIKNVDGRTMIEIPLAVGIAGAVLLPVFAAVGALAALAAKWTIAVVKESEPEVREVEIQ